MVHLRTDVRSAARLGRLKAPGAAATRAAATATAGAGATGLAGDEGVERRCKSGGAPVQRPTICLAPPPRTSCADERTVRCDELARVARAHDAIWAREGRVATHADRQVRLGRNVHVREFDNEQIGAVRSGAR